jgi:rod shape-determining protein MreD
LRAILKNIKIKWVAYALEMVIIFILQNTPGLIPSFLGQKPMLLVIFAVSIAIFEGDVAGVSFGIAAGALMDLTASSVFGFYTLIMMLVGYAAGICVIYLMRNNLVSCIVLSTAGVFFLSFVQWLFEFAIWGDAGTWYFLYGVILPRMIYSAALTPVAYYFNRSLAAHLSSDTE